VLHDQVSSLHIVVVDWDCLLPSTRELGKTSPVIKNIPAINIIIDIDSCL
jgi:hypothetical protein